MSVSRRPAVLPAIHRAARDVLLRPLVVGLFLALQLLVAWVMVAPARGLLHRALDFNLYGELMANGASWRWFDTLTRQHPELLGDLSILESFFSDEGVGLREIFSLSGMPAVWALCAFFLFWLGSLLSCAFLAHLHADRRGGFGSALVRFAPPATALTFFAALTYALAYGLLYVQLGRWAAPWREALDSHGAAIVWTWSRLALTGVAVLGVKILFDLSRVVLVERGGWNWPWAFLVALREMLRHGGRYALLTLGVLGLGSALLALLWWPFGWLLSAPRGWLTLLLAFLLQQIFLAARIALRLTQLASVHHLYLTTRSLEVEEKPPYKVEPLPRA